MTCGSIYKIQFPNGKHYIGLTTTSLEQRTNEHKCCAKKGDTKYLYKALRKYNIVDTFKLIEIDTAETLEELCNKEIVYIIEYNSYYMDKNGYNMTYGGDGVTGYIFTEEDKQKMSKAHKKRFEKPEAIHKNREAQKKYHQEHPDAGKEHSERMKKHFENPEVRQKNIEAQQKYWKENPEARQQKSEIKTQFYIDNPEAGKEHGERMKKHFENPEARQKYSESQKKRFENPEVRQQMSEIKKKRCETPEVREEMSERLIKYHQENPETRQRMSEIKKKHFEENPEARRKCATKGQHNPVDVFTKTFTYQFEAKEYLQTEYNITSTFKISEVLAGTRRSSAGFVFKYK
jgi:hypothetical protein